MALSEDFLQMVRCPVSGKPLVPADAELLARVNDAVASGRLKTRIGDLVTRPLDAGLVDRDGRYMLAVYDDIPNLIPDDSIPLDQL